MTPYHRRTVALYVAFWVCAFACMGAAVAVNLCF